MQTLHKEDDPTSPLPPLPGFSSCFSNYNDNTSRLANIIARLQFTRDKHNNHESTYAATMKTMIEYTNQQCADHCAYLLCKAEKTAHTTLPIVLAELCESILSVPPVQIAPLPPPFTHVKYIYATEWLACLRVQGLGPPPCAMHVHCTPSLGGLAFDPYQLQSQHSDFPA
eukprot:15350445-Ditylum_brightwellii.AAC.1